MDGRFVPGGTEMSSYAYCVQRDETLYGEDAEQFVPERWLESEKRGLELEAAQFVFGMGPRVCLGRDVAVMEMFKLLPEVSLSLGELGFGVLGTLTWIDREEVRR